MHTHHSTRVDVRGQLSIVSSLLPSHGLWGWSSAHQAWGQAHFPAELIHTGLKL